MRAGGFVAEGVDLHGQFLRWKTSRAGPEGQATRLGCSRSANGSIPFACGSTSAASCSRSLPTSIGSACATSSPAVIAVNTETFDVFRRLASRMGTLELTVTHDAGRRGSEAYGVNGIPHLVIIGRDGRIASANAGYDESQLDQIVSDINRALAAQ